MSIPLRDQDWDAEALIQRRARGGQIPPEQIFLEEGHCHP